MAADIPETLIELERTAEKERARLAGLDGEAYEEQRRAWRAAAERVQAAVTKYAGREDVEQSRYEVEMAVKKAVRYAD
ncbi:hypothetical protein [Streptomyces sp. NPDC059597]|uniref:hypothetical protein n=1 Tax=Streptomyces sp. NPDC059597 TaxID=3346879 RepID=UPI00369A00B4